MFRKKKNDFKVARELVNMMLQCGSKCIELTAETPNEKAVFEVTLKEIVSKET